MTPTNYSRLQPQPPTPADELCRCHGSPAVKLAGMGGLSSNPISCICCNLAVPPEHLQLDQGAVDAVANWLQTYGAIDALELASGAYEAWANDELTNALSPANESAYETRADLDRFRRCYFSFWQPGESIPKECPVCGEPLAPFEESWPAQSVCEHDSIIMFTGQMSDLPRP